MEGLFIVFNWTFSLIAIRRSKTLLLHKGVCERVRPLDGISGCSKSSFKSVLLMLIERG